MLWPFRLPLATTRGETRHQPRRASRGRARSLKVKILQARLQALDTGAPRP